MVGFLVVLFFVAVTIFGYTLTKSAKGKAEQQGKTKTLGYRRYISGFFAVVFLLALAVEGRSPQDVGVVVPNSEANSSGVVASEDLFTSSSVHSHSSSIASIPSVDVQSESLPEVPVAEIDAESTPTAQPEVTPPENTSSHAAPSSSHAPQSSSKPSGGTGTGVTMVWIPQTGSKYHSSSSCSNMKNPTQVTLERAIQLGYTPCKKCY